MTGFYLMHRGWMENDVFERVPFTEREAWEWMISAAAWDDVTLNILGRPTDLKRGQFSHSVRFMAEKFQWSKSAVDRFLDKLRKRDMILTETGTAQLIVSICNYKSYQYIPPENRDSIGTVSGTAAGQERDKEEIIKYLKQEKETAVDRGADGFFRAIYDAGSDLFPILATKRTEVINQWIAAGADPELVLSEFRRAVGRDVRTWGYFSGMIADAIKTRNTPLPQGSSRPTQAQPRKPNDWMNTVEAGQKAYQRRTRQHDDDSEY
jgi:DNA-binding transcriptional regulator YhcF (GntR family)